MLDPKDFEPKLEKWFKDWFEKMEKIRQWLLA